MKKVAAVLILLVITLFYSLSAHATVLTFDDLRGQSALPANYGGLVWGSGWSYYDWAQPPFNPQSPAERLYNNSGTPSIAFPTASVFDGAYFAGVGTASYLLYLNNGLVYQSTPVALSSTPTWVSSDYADQVDYVFLNVRQGGFVMDNFTYHDAATVPEPGTMILLSVGFAGLAVFGKRRQSTRS